MQCSLFASTAIADSATAVPSAVSKPASVNGGAPTAATRKAPKDGSIIVTVSMITGAAAGKLNHA
jgi:predicted carbohydrate-binding protein with CBM5 and CBM33 domain